MRRKSGINLRDICGEHIILAESKENIDFSNIISMNESSAYLWERIEDKEFDSVLLAHYLTEEYDVDMETAMSDAKKVIGQWHKAGIIE